MVDVIQIDGTLLSEPGGIIHHSIAPSIVADSMATPCNGCPERQGCVTECRDFIRYVREPSWQRGRGGKGRKG